MDLRRLVSLGCRWCCDLLWLPPLVRRLALWGTGEALAPSGLVDTVLLWVVRLAAVTIVIPSFFMAWYLAGSDDTALNPVAPLLGLGVFASSVWAVVRAFQLPAVVEGTLLVLALPFLLALVAWPFSGNRAVEREPLLNYVRSVLWLAAPFGLGVLYVASA